VFASFRLSMTPSPLSLELAVKGTTADSPAPVLLVSLEPRHQVFLRNLTDLFRLARSSSPYLVSRPGTFWPDVFVASHLPWDRFAQSAICHITVVAALWGAAQLWPQPPRVLASAVINHSDVIYYSPSEYLPRLDTGGAHKPLPQKGEPEYAPQPIISVPPEADNHTQTIVTPTDVKLNHDVPLPNIIAWAQPQPAVPLASTAGAAIRSLPALPAAVVAPAPETMPDSRQRAPSLSQTVVAPAPDVNIESPVRSLQAPQAAVIQPPPSMDATTERRLRDINIGRSAVVAPAPELPVVAQYAIPGRGQPALGGGTAVVPPSPSLAGNFGFSAGGRLIALGIHPTVQAPTEMPGGNRRGTFAATPAGKAGAPGTPDVSAGTSRGSSSGSGTGNNNGLPPGLSVGAPPDGQAPSAIAGHGQGLGNGAGKGSGTSYNSDGSRLVADASPPRVGAAPTRTASEVSPDKASEVEHWIFGDRKFYSMTLNMPNLNSAGGSWVIRFAELNGNQTKGELTAPVATQKVDPAYPLELMRRNVLGTVTLYAVIRSDGSVSDVRVLNGVDDRLDQYARNALAQWHFRPATKNGSAVDLEAVVRIPFRPVRLKSSF
jgi:TonB family protein